MSRKKRLQSARGKAKPGASRNKPRKRVPPRGKTKARNVAAKRARKRTRKLHKQPSAKRQPTPRRKHKASPARGRVAKKTKRPRKPATSRNVPRQAKKRRAEKRKPVKAAPSRAPRGRRSRLRKPKETHKRGFRRRKRALQDGRQFLERWDFFEFSPPVNENYAASIVDEWLTVESKPAALDYFDKVAPNEFVFVRAFVQARMIQRGRVLDDVWSSGVKLPIDELEFDRLADLIDRIGGYGTNLQVLIMRIELAYTTLPRTANNGRGFSSKSSSKGST